MKNRIWALLLALAMLLTLAPTALADTATGTGTAKGFGGDITVTVTLEDGVITAVEAVGESETAGIGQNIITEWPQVFVDANGIVDTYSGATFAMITRPAFIEATRAALTEAGVNPDDYLREATEEAAEDVELTADVVIVGAGGAGMTAAIVAADAGMNVVLLESQPAVGGNSVKSTGGMNAGKTADQDENTFDEAAGVEKTLKAAADNWADNETITALAATVQAQWDAYQANPEGYFDSTELFALDTMIGGKGINDPELVNTLVNGSADAIEWLRTQNIDLTDVSSFGGASVKRIHRPLNDEGKVVSVGAYTVPLLETAVKARENITLLTDTTATEILTNEGAACGVKATGKTGNAVTVLANAVVLTTGGFGANLDMVVAYKPDLAGFMTTNASGIQGQGIAMAEALGAATVDMEQIQIHPTVQAETASLITEGLRGDGAILVNANGERFIDEVGTRDVVSAAEIAQPDS
ncbi:MAG: FAD-dependent oxidoreductase, partial [bacterium]